MKQTALRKTNSFLVVLLITALSVLDVEGFAISTPLRTKSARANDTVGLPVSGSTARRSSSRAHTSSMFFDFGKAKESTGRPVAGGTVKGGKKSKIVQEVSPAAKRQQAATQRRSAAQTANKKLEGVFTPPQFEAFQRARREVPSGSGQAYWNAIAARVPGQNAAACKGMAESLLFEKAVGTKSNYFGGYIETKETPDYVDPDADIFVRLGKFFGKKSGE